MHFFVWAKKCQETHQHCMLDRSAFYPQGVQCASPQKAWQKRLYHMVASRCKNHFSLLANGYRDLNKVIEQLANQQANIVTFSEWVDGTMDSRVEDRKLFCVQIVPRRVLIVPHEYSRQKSQWAVIANCVFQIFIKSTQAKSVYLRSGGGKNATTLALRWIIEVR